MSTNYDQPGMTGSEVLAKYLQEHPVEPESYALARAGIDIVVQLYKLSEAKKGKISPSYADRLIRLDSDITYSGLVESMPVECVSISPLPDGTADFPQARVMLTSQGLEGITPGTVLYLSGVILDQT